MADEIRPMNSGPTKDSRASPRGAIHYALHVLLEGGAARHGAARRAHCWA
jgi:hypothetical protein